MEMELKRKIAEGTECTQIKLTDSAVRSGRVKQSGRSVKRNDERS